jgi:hypothetical protein
MTTPEFDEELNPDDSEESHHELPYELNFDTKPLPEKEDIAQVDPSEIKAEQAFEELTLSELIGQFLRAPRATYCAVKDIARTSAYADAPAAKIPAPFVTLDSQKIPDAHRIQVQVDRESLQLIGEILAFVLAVWGVRIWGIDDSTHSKDQQLASGLPFILMGILLWVVAEIYGKWPVICAWWQGQATRSPSPVVDTADEFNIKPKTWERSHLIRVFLGLGAIVFTYVTWWNTADNRFTFLGFWGWLLSIVFIVAAFAPDTWNPLNLWQRLRERVRAARFKVNWTFFALIAIMFVGAYFRLHDLDGMPPQMTSDHKEKLLDAQRVLEGEYSVFFPNNGGREGFQMYALALFSYLPGLGIDHFSLKVLAVAESLITLPVLWWMGREVIGERDRQLGNAVGLILMALVAVSYWHIAITRVALRIILTPLFAALLAIFLSRAMRYNRRGDFVLAGLVLGIGLYTYQAARMLPVVVLVGVGSMLLMHLRNGHTFRRYLVHLSLLVIVSFVIFMPLFRFSMDSPELFWMRTNGRILGESIIEDLDNEGNVIFRDATTDERIDAFRGNMSILLDNIRRAFLMYSWQGDEAWFHGSPHHPAMDIFTGGLLIVGVGAWLILTIQRRDPVYVLIPLMVFIMLLPSALSIGRPTENPSATRASGSLPQVYLIAALPLALISTRTRRVVEGQIGIVVSVGVVAMLIGGAYWANSTLYFGEYREKYRVSTWPYSEPGQMLRGFAMSDGDYGNAFMISYDYWWDSTIVGMEGGILDWPNGINTGLTLVEEFLRDAFYCVGTQYPVNPDRDLLFFYHYADDEHEAKLREWFPVGYPTLVESYKESYNYKIYRVPALGVAGFLEFIEQYTEPPTCTPRDFEEN